MNWYKFSQVMTQSTNSSEQNLGNPNINIRPYEPLIQEAVNQLKTEAPHIFDSITDINVDMGYGQFGSVNSQSPTVVNINLNKIKDQVRQQLKGSDADPQIRQALIDAIKETIIHEQAHVATYDAEKNEFVGGEMPAERAQKQYVDQMQPLRRS